MRRLFTVLLVTSAALAALVTPAQAHNVLTGSDPKDGATVTAVPRRVTLTFDQPVRADFAKVAVTAPGGAVTQAALEVVDAKVSAELPAGGAAGAYIIGYQILSNDGHPVTGKIEFTVTGPAAGQSASPPSAGTTASPGTGSTPATGAPSPAAPGQGVASPVAGAAVPGTSGGGWVWGVLIAALLLSGLGILVVARQARLAGGGGA
ncbi:copper resistance protein CopC [Sphaerisporangium melleum]|uniref:copper resistance CopC family protein n=1 Tax=Sphaerisporangium melleum TaxID=321316 RepID=UPI00166A98E6|nr:copper resistance CopC family protein [Sphaerisporangium melleum]